MKQFAKLFDLIDQTQSTNEKVAYIKDYFLSCTDEDGAWALFFLCGHRLKRLIGSQILLTWTGELTSYPDWLMEESYAAVGDTAETISLLLPRHQNDDPVDRSLTEWIQQIIQPLRAASLERKREVVVHHWAQLNQKELFIFNKILTGAFRVGVSKLLTLKALSEAFGVPREILAQRLMGHWEPTGTFFQQLKSTDLGQRYLNPYPFYLAHPFEGELTTLGLLADWLIEWKWDGIRGQAVIRDGDAALWSRGNELISDQFPELIEIFRTLPSGTVLDGEVLAYHERPLPFSELQKRLGRKNVSKSMIESVPVVFMIYDILEYQDQDLRSQSLLERRRLLQQLTLNSPRLLLSPIVEGHDWPHILTLRTQAREKNTEGLMLKKLSSAYGVGRQKGDWWKYKVDPMTIDAVLIYAQAGSGRRANLFTDYTFGVWKENELVPIAKAYSGLDQAEIDELDRWIRKNTEEKFGPVRKVKAHHVFELGFEGIQKSNRHKSEVALRFPRILRWRKDKPIEECDTIESIKQNFLHD